MRYNKKNSIPDKKINHQVKPKQRIKVGIIDETEICNFVLEGEFYIKTSRKKVKGSFKSYVKDSAILIESETGEKVYNSKRIDIIPSQPDKNTVEIKDIMIGIKFHWEQKQTLKFRGSLILVRKGNKICVINELSIEEYLISVISSEMNALSPLELLKSHSIMSRSFIINQVINKNRTIKTDMQKTDRRIIKWYGREEHKLYDVCADDHCQRYQGITKVISNRVYESVKSTCGIVMLNSGQVCDARYSKCCGGYTEEYGSVWENRDVEYLKPVFDNDKLDSNYIYPLNIEKNAEKWINSSPASYCCNPSYKILDRILVDFDRKTDNFYRWKIEYTQEHLQDLLKRKLNIDIGRIKNLIPLKRGLSSRIIELKISGTNRDIVIGKELEIRRALSESHLYSSAFVVEPKKVKGGIPGIFCITGAGWGHGVGLCQIGAGVMAAEGKSYNEILSHYYSHVELKKIY